MQRDGLTGSVEAGISNSNSVKADKKGSRPELAGTKDLQAGMRQARAETEAQTTKSTNLGAFRAREERE